MAEPYLYFLRDDLDALDAMIERFEGRKATAAGGIHESTTQTSETWHDNPAFDAQQADHKMNDTEAKRLKAIKARAVLVDPSLPSAAIGSRVRYRYAGDDEVLGVTIVSAENHGAKDDAFGDRSSYLAALGASLIGRRQGEPATFQIEGRKPVEIVVVEVLGAAGDSPQGDTGPAVETPVVAPAELA